MPLYHFHFRDVDELSLDNEGVELPDAEAARREALQAAGDLLQDAKISGFDYSSAVFEVCSDDGRELFVFPISRASARAGPGTPAEGERRLERCPSTIEDGNRSAVTSVHLGMSPCPFPRPVGVVLVGEDGQRRLAMIDNARAAMRTMSDGLGRFALDRPDWQHTFMALGYAVVDPTPEKLQAARDAFARFAATQSGEPVAL